MKNTDLREAMKAAGVKHWQVAECAGMSEFTFSRRLRHELPQEEKDLLLRIVREIRNKGDS